LSQTQGNKAGFSPNAPLNRPFFTRPAHESEKWMPVFFANALCERSWQQASARPRGLGDHFNLAVL
jgi:hypothetical protein